MVLAAALPEGARAQVLPDFNRTHAIGGIAYVEVPEVAAWLGMDWHWIEKGVSMELRSSWTQIRIEQHKREIQLNQRRLHLGDPIAMVEGKICIALSDVRHQLMPVLTPQLCGPAPMLRRIVLDPGHGGQDPGAENTLLGLREKALTLDLARRLARDLESMGYDVSMTRNSDTFIELPERARIANAAGADLFISLHFNAIANETVSGLETYVLTPPGQPSTARAQRAPSDAETHPGNAFQAWSALVGWYVQDTLAASLPAPDRGLKRARFAVLRGLEMPGILVEAGFLTHPQEGRNIGSAGYRDQLAGAIAGGVQQYAKTLERLHRGE